MVITGVFCDTEAQIASFAEAHLGAQLSVLEATRAINKAEGKDACSPIANVIVGSREEVKQIKLGGKGYTISRLRVIGLMIPTPAGLLPRSVPALEQYVLAKSKSEEI
jgi:hypothetical protein